LCLTRSPTPLMKVRSPLCQADILNCAVPRCLTPSISVVNVQKLKLWDDESEFDAEKNKAHFRQYEDACDRVKNFYKEQHGTDACLVVCLLPHRLTSVPCGNHRKADCRLQHPGSRQLQEPTPCPHGYLAGHGNAQHPRGRVGP
jgi:hypothetical protein